MVNDSVSIILYLAVFDLLDKKDYSVEIELITPVNLLIKFVINLVSSLLIGALTGMVCCALLKNCRFITKLHSSAVLENAIIFLFGYMAYTICEIFEVSGVIGILVCGIIMAHYMFYNISSMGKISTGITFETIA